LFETFDPLYSAHSFMRSLYRAYVSTSSNFKLKLMNLPRYVVINLLESKMRLDLQEPHDLAMYPSLLRGNLYEPESTAAICSLLHPGDTFVDIGANNGYYTVIASKRVGAQGKVYSFEPARAAYERLTQNIALNGLSNVKAFQIALSSSGGVGKLFHSQLEDGQNSVRPDAVGGRTWSMSESVVLLTFDEALPDLPVSVVKIDVEGLELEVLRGMGTTISMNPTVSIILEWNARLADPNLLEYLLERFKVFLILSSKTGFRLATVTTKHQMMPRSCNLLCVARNVSSMDIGLVGPEFKAVRSA
jgi:FkbM family methyltransferase